MRRREFLAGALASAAAHKALAREFQPQPGFSWSGAIRWDQDITITNPDNAFGSVGPTLVMFDDFRGGAPGNQIAHNTPGVAGTSKWQSGAGRFGNPIYVAGNRSGSGNSIRIYNANNTYSPHQLLLSFASTIGIYIFWAENSHGGNYNAFTKNFGNPWNYKMHWFMQNQHSGGAFNEWLPALFGGSGPCYQQFASNDVPPLPNWWVADPSKWDPNHWTSAELAFVGNAANPTGANGLIYLALYNPKNNGQWAASNTSKVLFSATTGKNGDYASANTLSVPGLIQGVPAGVVIDRADYYVAIGPYCMARFFIGNASTVGACTSIMPCMPVSWAAGSWTIRLRRGAAPSPGPSGWSLYGSDARNRISLVGTFP